MAGKWAIAVRIGDMCTMGSAAVSPLLPWPSADVEHRQGALGLEDLRGEVLFVSGEEQVQRSAELLGAGALLVTLPPPTLEARGRLGDVLEELVERELARRGAPSAYLSAWSAMPEDAQARFADQLFRTRSVGATGLAIAMGSLAAIARPSLTADDSATLRWLADLTMHAPLVVLVDDADEALLGYAAPLPLAGLLSRPRITLASDVVELAPEDATSIDGVVYAEAAPPTDAEPAPEMREVEVEAEAEAHADVEVHAEVEAHAEPEPVPEAIAVPDAIAVPEAIAEPEPPPAPERRRRPRAAAAVRAGVPVSGPSDAWRTWTIALAAAKGAQPLHAFERLFTESYVPLAHAIAQGLDDTRALRAYDEFRRSFERSYTDAFATFGATNRRPKLVMDAFDLASKQARLASARSAHVIVVDSMRYDLGVHVRDALGTLLGASATLVGELLLWSALPTTTMRQLETLARGMDALRAPAREEPSESLRGRAAELMRRVRVGSRELHKLDLVPAMLESAVGDVPGALPAIGEATAQTLARHIAALPARTLVYVVGDHGFTIDRHGDVHTGGASPEEVLVPAHAWLLGDLH